MKANFSVSSAIRRTPRVMQLEGMFDVPPSERSSQSWSCELPLEEKRWNVGLIVGPSGCGKSSIARQLWPEQMAAQLHWNKDNAVVDDFAEHLGIKDIVEALSSVGFSSPPSWLKPFHVLSNGEQFRATLARTIAEASEVAVVDEFTSVVDRTVAKIGSYAVGKSVRRRGGKFVAVTCHDDVEEWLAPDWVYRPAEQIFAWRSEIRRPKIELVFRRIDRSPWDYFKRHHYLSSRLLSAATCFGAFLNGKLVAFDSWIQFYGRLPTLRKAKQSHRTVCLPDYQGIGIGGALVDWSASLWLGMGYRAFRRTSHPMEKLRLAKSSRWRQVGSVGLGHYDRIDSLNKTRSISRSTCGYEYVGLAMNSAQASELLGKSSIR